MKRLFSTLLALALALFTFSAPAVELLPVGTSLTAFAAPAAPTAPAVPNAITAENIQLEYEQTVFTSGKRTPAVTVKMGDTILAADVDYTVKYPDDCINAGDKTIIVTGKGNYSGEAKLNYRITPVSCADDPDVVITASDCYYNGLPQAPELTVKYGDITVPKSDYTLTLSDNVEVGDKAVCTVKFRGNYSGERTVSFNILKRRMKDFEVDVVAGRGQAVSIDLAPLKPAGAIFGKPFFEEGDFAPNDQPRVAFNVLRFTLSPDIRQYSYISVPMTNILNCEDYRLEFYIEVTDKEIPKLTLKPVTKEYDGRPAGISFLMDSGCSAFLNGQEVEGEWDFAFWTEPPVLPCEEEYFEVKFTPNNPELSYAYGLVPITVTRKSVPEFDADASRRIDVGETLKVTVTGIPDGFDGTVTVSGKEDDGIIVLSEEDNDDGGKVFELEFPFDDARYILEAKLCGSAFYAPKTVDLKVTVGNPQAEPADVVTTARMLSELIGKAEPGSTVKANKTPLISADILRAALAKDLTIEVKANDAVTYVIEPDKMKYITPLDLGTAAAVIPQVLLDKTGDTVAAAFTSNARNFGGVSVKTTINSKQPITCFYLYSTSGELERIASTPLKGQTASFAFTDAGKYVITASRVSHMPCDFDNNCKITVSDVTTAISIYMNISGKPTEDESKAIDFDGNGKGTLADISALIKYYMEL